MVLVWGGGGGASGVNNPVVVRQSGNWVMLPY